MISIFLKCWILSFGVPVLSFASGGTERELMRAVKESMQGRISPVDVLKWDDEKLASGMYRIPYYFDQDLGNSSKEAIASAVEVLYAQTCIQFEPARLGDTSIIRFANSSAGCSSFIGRKSPGISTIYGCNTVGSVLNALMNALGFIDETLRPNRDTYVILFQERMFFDKLPLVQKMDPGLIDTYDLFYDRSSITSFGPYQYSEFGEVTVYDNSTGKPVMKNRWSLSLGDITKINKLYNCSGVTGIPANTGCYDQIGDGVHYRGNVSVTENGLVCQRWNLQRPQSHQMRPSLLTGSGLVKNYCRNPNNLDRPWCYTVNSSVRWEYCNISECGTSSPLVTPTPLTSERGFWGPWSAYTRCSRTCGDGNMYRIRACIGAEMGSRKCPGEYWTHLECNYGNCSDEHQWNNWRAWSECDAECGNGTHTRTRRCNGFYGLDECLGDSVETAECFTSRTCPIYLGGECYNNSNPLGFQGSINISRSGTPCINWTNANFNVSAYPGADLQGNECRNPDQRRSRPYCFISARRISPCNVTLCNRRALWGNWGRWSSCSASCGEGLKTRTRQCFMGHYGQGQCTGAVFMTDPCNATCCNGTPCIPDDEVQPPVTRSPRPIRTGRECIDFRNPHSYRGTQNQTKSGETCQYWDSLQPWLHNYTTLRIIQRAGLTENYCRMPDPEDKEPWCFVNALYPRKEECYVRPCSYTDSLRSYFIHLWSSFLQSLETFSSSSQLQI